jgi:hypothetical protein
MALFNPGDSKNPVTSVPHRLLFGSWKGRLAPLEVQAIHVELDRLVRNKRGAEIITTHWLPCELSTLGRLDWERTALSKIWEKACERDRSRTCWCFALFLWEHMMTRPEAWYFEAIDLADAPLAATRYYRCQTRPVQRKSANPLLATS